MVPKGWTVGTLSELADTVMGFAFKSSDFTPTGIPLLRMGNLYQNTLDFERNPEYLPESFKDEYARFLVRPGDLVMSMTGTMGKRDYGFTVEIPSHAPDSLLNQRVMKFVPKKKTSAGYLLNLLRSEVILSRLYSFPGGTKQANLSAKQVQELVAPIPPLPEQRKIAKILSTWDKAITITEQLLANSQQQKKALMQQLLTGKKRLLDNNGVRFCGEWKRLELSSFTDIYSEKSVVNNQLPIVTSSRRGLFLQEDYFKKQVASEDNTGYKIVPYGYITFRSMSDDGIFVFNQQTILDNALISPAYGVFCFTNIDTTFGCYLLNSSVMMREVNKLSQGGTRIAFKTSTFNSIYLSIPAKEEQQKIASVLSTADKEVTALQQRLDALKQEKQALMQQLLTGKRRVRVEAVA
ncbi:restriction endonuclease subunit S [Aeromonas caviae]|uniref:restriction endonuclease subunit S n=1 Tax=Aeromonas TaxID=642 RepID=UPI0022E5889A|nr:MULTISPECIES: restriction endonuclease subunit S [Aeromonas]MEB5774081.1 restriction endonuclease subunit S [Aeromonas caviae]MEB6649349.1 restriction endonuclease subunit S [Aeromonas caviae]